MKNANTDMLVFANGFSYPYMKLLHCIGRFLVFCFKLQYNCWHANTSMQYFVSSAVFKISVLTYPSIFGHMSTWLTVQHHTW